MSTGTAQPDSRSTLRACVLFFALFASVLFLTHAPFLSLPYFWDEMGQFVPAALDIFEKGAWIPQSTLPNVHPPGIMAYLAAFWNVTGYSVAATRTAMLLLAALGTLAAFLLAIELCGRLPGAPALLAVALLLASPLFYIQAMMSQLDMPAMVFTALAVYLFLKNRILASAGACIALVLAKETGATVPLVLGAWLVGEKRLREASYFLVPFAALAVWLACLTYNTGHVLGNREFAHYNVTFPLHPARLIFSVLRRLYFLLVADFHWIGTIAILIAWRRTTIFRSRSWAVVAAVACAHLLLVIVLGGAGLERYLLPLIPLFYIAVAAAWTTFKPLWRRVSALALAGGLLAAHFWNPPYPAPFENNLAMVDFVKLQKRAAEYIESNHSGAAVVSAWPFADALRRPEFGYVSKSIRTRGIENFHAETVLDLKESHPDILVLYSRTWEPGWGVLQLPAVESFLREYYHYRPQITSEQIQRELRLYPVARWERRGQWIEVYAREAVLFKATMTQAHDFPAGSNGKRLSSSFSRISNG
ncbi:MAG: hypothetical protein ACRD7E_28280 [Bryobacteraceae bacterium]